MTDIILLGLTGSIGMGKSETAKMFRRMNIPVFDSDQAVHELLGPGGAAVSAVARAFPGLETGQGIDRKKLGAQVFGDGAALKNLEAILHPLVSAKRQQFLRQAAMTGHDMAVADVPLLFETNGDQVCDYTVVVSAAPEVQRQRVLARPGMSLKKFEQILSKQMPDEEKRHRADFIVQTDRGIEYAETQVRELIAAIREKNPVKDNK